MQLCHPSCAETPKRHYANQIFLLPKSHLWQCIIYSRISKGLVKRQLEWQYIASRYQIMGYPHKRMYNELFNLQLFYQNCWDHARDRNYYILIINKCSEFIFKVFSLNFLTMKRISLEENDFMHILPFSFKVSYLIISAATTTTDN